LKPQNISKKKSGVLRSLTLPDWAIIFTVLCLLLFGFISKCKGADVVIALPACYFTDKSVGDTITVSRYMDRSGNNSAEDVVAVVDSIYFQEMKPETLYVHIEQVSSK